MTSTINLFRLPYLATTEVLRNMDLGELIEISRISKKSFKYVHGLFSRKNIGQFKLNVYLSDQFSIGITSVNTTSQGYTEFNVNHLSKLTTEVLENMTKLLNYPVIVWKITKVCSQTRSLMALVQSLNLRTDEVIVRQRDANAEMLDDIMKLCTNSKKASIDWKTPESFLLDETLYQPFYLDLLCIRQASWVTVSVVTKLFMNCKRIFIHGNTSKPRDITEFIKKWIVQPKIERIFIDCESKSIPEILAGIPSEQVHSFVRNEIEIDLPERTCYKVRGFNGQEAAVFYLRNQIVLSADYHLL